MNDQPVYLYINILEWGRKYMFLQRVKYSCQHYNCFVHRNQCSVHKSMFRTFYVIMLLEIQVFILIYFHEACLNDV